VAQEGLQDVFILPLSPSLLKAEAQQFIIMGPQPPYPLHESVKDRLDAEYVKFYNEHVIDKQQVHLQPVEASRTSGILIPGGGPKQPVGSTQDISIPRRETSGPDIKLRVFTPDGTRPEKGWPLMVYYHGGGWVLGNIDTENTVCTHLCSRAKCVVVTVDYLYLPPLPPPKALSLLPSIDSPCANL
jgi:triacylglycerol lipase